MRRDGRVLETVELLPPDSNPGRQGKEIVMNIFPKILCAVDFSPCSRLTSHYGRELAAQLGSELALLHVKPSIAEVYENIAPELATYITHDDPALIETFNDFSGDWTGRYEKLISSGVPHEEIQCP